MKRAETFHSARRIREPDWPAAESRASMARLNEMVLDDAYAAIDGIADERVEGFDFGLGPARIFRPDRVKSLAVTIGELDEAALRQAADFEVMDRDDVQPSGWLVEGEGEAILSTYVLPALRRLKAFYAAGI